MSQDSSDAPKTNLKRSWSTVRALGRIFWKNLEERLGSAPDHEAFARILTEELGHLKGPIMKIGQILGTVPGMLPPAYADAFMTLSAHAPPMGPTFVNRRMAGALGPDWRTKFDTFEDTPAFAASLGQVHKATTKDGHTVAMKLQYPGMDDVIETDLKHLRLVCKLYERYGQAILTDNFQHEVRDRLYEELDYLREAKHVSWFRHVLKNEDGVALPEVYPDLCTKHLLTLSWLDGDSILAFKDAPLAIRQKIADRLFRAWWAPLYTGGLLHGDPHLGNYTICRRDHTLNVLDFGCVRVFNPDTVNGIKTLFKGLADNNDNHIRGAYDQLGFGEVSKDVQDVLTLWARFLYDPLLDNRVRPITLDPSGAEGRKLAEKVHTLLRQHGGIMPPREFVFLDRAAVGIGSALMRLGVELNWHTLFCDLIARPTCFEVVQKNDVF